MEQSQEQAGLRRSGVFGGRSSSVGSQPLPRQQGGGTRAGSREAEVRKASSGWALKFEAGRSCWLLWQRRRCIFFFLPQPLGLQPAALTLHGGPASKAWNPSPCPYSVPSFFFLEGGSIFPLGWHFFCVSSSLVQHAWCLPARPAMPELDVAAGMETALPHPARGWLCLPPAPSR